MFKKKNRLVAILCLNPPREKKKNKRKISIRTKRSNGEAGLYDANKSHKPCASKL